MQKRTKMVSESYITVRYAETDKMGIAHHSNYPVWFEVARTDYIKNLGITYSQMEEMGILVPLLSLECTFKGAAKYEDELCVRCYLSNLSRVKIEFSYEILKDGKIISLGKTLHGIVSPKLMPFNLEKKFPDLYNLLLNAVVSSPA